IATAMPNDVWLTSFVGGKGNGTGGTLGTINVGATGFDQTSAAHWLIQIGGLDIISNLWLPSSAKQGTGAAATDNFTSTGDLTQAAHNEEHLTQCLGEQ